MGISSTLEHLAGRVLDKLYTELGSSSTLVLATGDGFTVASRGAAPEALNKLSAMGGTISALGAMAGKETGLGRCSSVTIEAERGFVVIVEVPHQDFPMTLQVVATSNHVLAQVLYLSRRASIVLSKH